MNDDALTGVTVEAARRELARHFRNADLESPELDARLLVGAALNLDLTGMSVAAARLVIPSEAGNLAALARRRLHGEPVARILGIKEFWGLSFELSVETLVPRGDTETVVEVALELARANTSMHQSLRIADVGTGSGAILLALLSELPDASGIGVDISTDALQTARRNARHLDLSHRATFAISDYMAALDGAFDLIVSNPPYIATAEIASLAAEVRDHDPRRALDGGADGLAAYRVISRESIERLTLGGALVVEVGHRQAEAVAEIMRAAGLAVSSRPRPDLSGIPRVVVGHRSGS